jgi:hypothetical protein
MSNYMGMEKRQPEKLSYLPNINTLLKISLGLIFFTMISTALVYAESLSVDVDGTSYDVDYTATGMTVSGIDADLDFISLIFTVDVTSSGTLDVTLDRAFFDSTYNGADEDFIILADGDEPSFTETVTNSQSRTVSIELPVGTEEVEIIGSSFDNIISEPTPKPVDEPTPEPVDEPTPEPVDEPTPEPVDEPTPTPVDDTPKTQCGPGTILKDGACVLDERCGPGTILKDGACVLDSSSESKTTVSKGMGKELGYGLIAAFVVTGAIAVILGLMSKASKSKD